MTIEIRQLVIRAVVDERAAAVPAAAPHGLADARSGDSLAGPAALAPDDSQALVTACVNEVLRRLEQSRDR